MHLEVATHFTCAFHIVYMPLVFCLPAALGALRMGGLPLARWLHGPLREWALLEILEGRRARWPWIEQSCLDGMERELQSRRVTDAEWTWNRLMLLQWSRHWRPAA